MVMRSPTTGGHKGAIRPSAKGTPGSVGRRSLNSYRSGGSRLGGNPGNAHKSVPATPGQKVSYRSMAAGSARNANMGLNRSNQ